MFASFVKFFSTDKVEVKRPNQLPIFLLDNVFTIDKKSKKSMEK